MVLLCVVNREITGEIATVVRAQNRGGFFVNDLMLMDRSMVFQTDRSMIHIPIVQNVLDQFVPVVAHRRLHL
jgi:hypothetical protein